MNKPEPNWGRLNGTGFHSFPIRVYYEDTDAAGIVYYANYLRFAERARTELLRDIGVAHEYIKKNWKVEFVVRSCNADYIRPASLDESLEVLTSCKEIMGASITLRQVVARDGEELVVMDVKIASRHCEGATAARIPTDVRAAFQQFKYSEFEG